MNRTDGLIGKGMMNTNAFEGSQDDLLRSEAGEVFARKLGMYSESDNVEAVHAG